MLKAYYLIISMCVNEYDERTLRETSTRYEAEQYVDALIEEDRACGCEAEYMYSISGPHFRIVRHR